MRRVVVYAGTRKVYRQMAAAAKSLLRHTRVDRVWFLIEDDAFPEELPGVIRTMNLSGQTWLDRDGPNYGGPLTYMSMIRLALPAILPAESRCLWLDTDTIVRDDIGELLDMDMCGCYVAMAQEPPRCKYPFLYYNAGVMLMNLDRIREDRIWQRWLLLVNRTELTAQEQDAVNLVCQGWIRTVPAIWNCAVNVTVQTAMEDAKIMHYAGTMKYLGDDVFREYEDADWRVIT